MIKCENLTKNFRSFKKQEGLKGSILSLFKRDYIEKTAVNGFDLDIKQGEIVGLLGPNGAGKTTLMKMFTGIIVPSHGELIVNSHRPWDRHKNFRKHIALVMGQKSQLWWDIPAMDSFRLLQKYYEIEESDFQQRLNEMGELLNVKHLFHIHVRKLSLGERMKLELMASLLHQPDVIFLDEPTIGLDLVAQENIREFIKSYHEKHNITIILTSHYMADVEALCERIVLIFDGKKLYDGSIRSFEKILGHKKTVTFVFKDTQNINDDFWKDLDTIWHPNQQQVELKIDEEDLQKKSIEILDKYSVKDFYTEKVPVEKVMKTLMQNPEILRQQ